MEFESLHMNVMMGTRNQEMVALLTANYKQVLFANIQNNLREMIVL